MLENPLRHLVAAAVVLLLGCGSTIKASMDTGVDQDTPPDEGMDTTVDSLPDLPPDVDPDTLEDPEPDTEGPECSDGIDNDGDDLIDMEDFDCSNPGDDPEGPGDGCSIDNHCEAGWWECDRDTGECYDPPEGAPCDPCYRSEDCGDGVTGSDTNRDFCVYYGMSGRCTKDCHGDFDCPKGFYCDPDVDPPHPGMCLPVTGSCTSLESIGEACSRDEDCGWGDMAVCEESVCTSLCEVEHDCPMGWSCVTGMCEQD